MRDPVHHRTLFLDAFEQALRAVNPERATRSALESADLPGPITVCALGKAAPAMARAAHDVLGKSIVNAVVVSDHPGVVPEGHRLIIGSHPLPDERSVIGGTALLEAAENTHADGTLVVLVSGGGSALAEVPVEGLTIDEIAATYDSLIHASVPIEEVNTVRRHLSLLKNGGLRRASAALAMTVCISDVVDGPPSAIASGPTLRDNSGPADALAVLDRHQLLKTIPRRVVERLVEAGTPTVDDRPHRVEVIADGAMAAEAAAAASAERGCETQVVTTALTGDAATEAQRFVQEVRPGVVSVVAGEPTVTVIGGGTGGRNQHAALAAAIAIDGTSTVLAALGTDGRDGCTDATGAIVDGNTASRIRAAGIDPQHALKECDSHPALDAAGDLIRTGPTGTNVGDLWMVWRP